jgi:hypothetical protein
MEVVTMVTGRLNHTGTVHGSVRMSILRGAVLLRITDTLRPEVFTAVTKNNAVFWDIKTVLTSQETHYVSATELSRLKLCKI